MKPMVWHPEEKDAKVNQYLESVNREPWVLLWGAAILMIGAFTSAVLVGIF
ncbi:hypothetical protein KR51_00035920 [Rubidibacter lacunae KORDI 51-2]|uniref:Uncharacterized protein n=1 Tax=Rubidibacter lacunae KORDI 51-2 TaxID=582515 RepID=U5DEE2_9CHRO|nr:hypothetical protein [Rubidibacter lacunae]ERN39991.1 hypothetical protein KR51_00035920 [Rubidibacter lacunae KORDI 51-2]